MGLKRYRWMKQQTLAMAADQTFENYRKPTRRDKFLKTMEAIVPWSVLREVIGPHYPKQGARRVRNRTVMPRRWIFDGTYSAKL